MATIHRIDELLFDLAFESPAMAIARADTLRTLVVDKLLPLMDNVFDQFGNSDDGGDDEVWQIDKLEIDIGDVTEAELPAALIAGLRKALEVALHDSREQMAKDSSSRPPGNKTNSVRRIERHRVDDEILLEFLADGTMPWQMNTVTASHETLLARVLDQGAEGFLAALSASPRRATMLARLARQFASVQLQQLLRRANSGHADLALSHLAGLQTLLEDAGLARMLWRGALHASWEMVLDAALAGGPDRPSGLPQALIGRALTWLAMQRRQDVATTAAQLLHALPSAVTADRSDAVQNDLVHAIRSFAGAAALADVVDIVDIVDVEVAADEIDATSRFSASHASQAEEAGANLSSEGLAEEWRALAQHRHDPALLMRLVRQSSPALLQNVLRRFNPAHATSLLARLDSLWHLLERSSFSTGLVQAALSAAWEYVLSASLAHPSALPATVAWLEQVIAALAETTATTMPAAAAVRQRELVLTQLRKADAALDHRTELSVTLAAMADIPDEIVSAGAPPPMAMAPMRNRVTTALMGGTAGDVYEDWCMFVDDQPDLLRSAFLHYGGYGEIREKIASTFPLSLLLDLLALLAPEAAALTLRVWSDAELRNRFLGAGTAHWTQWRRNWWRGGVTYLLSSGLLQTAREQRLTTATTASDTFDTTAYIAAAVAAVEAVSNSSYTNNNNTASSDDSGLSEPVTAQISAYITALAQQPASDDATVLHRQTPVLIPTLTSLFEAMRSDARLLQQTRFSIAQLEQWVAEAVREPSFHQAIVAHAAVARNRHAYYIQVLHALAQNRIVDLEEFATAEPQRAALEEPGQHPTRTISVAETPDDRDKAYLVGRLAKALMKGDAALLYGDWDVLLHKHAALLGEAVRHYAIRDDILERITRSFPESMLYDMAVLLAPRAMSAWRALRDQHTWSTSVDELAILASGEPGDLSAMNAMNAERADQTDQDDDGMTASTPEVFAAWKRRIWSTALHLVLHGAKHDEGNLDGDVERNSEEIVGSSRAVLASLADVAGLAQLAWQRDFLMHWSDQVTRLITEAHEAKETTVATGARTTTTAKNIAGIAGVADTQASFRSLQNDVLSVEAQPTPSGALTQIDAVAKEHAAIAGDVQGEEIRTILHQYRALISSAQASEVAAIDLHAFDSAAELSASISASTSLLQSATALLPVTLNEAVRADLLNRFARLCDQPAQIAAAWSTADIETLIAAYLAARNTDQASQQQRDTFLRAIAAQAPLTSEASREAYFKSVLLALLQEQILDLEEIAEASSDAWPDPESDVSRKVSGNALNSAPTKAAMSSVPTMSTVSTMPSLVRSQMVAAQDHLGHEHLVQDYINFLLSAGFRAGAAPSAALVEWLRRVIAAAPEQASDLAPLLRQLSRHPDAVARLLDLLPPSSWPKLARMTSLSPRQVQRMQRYASDIADMFAEQNRQLSTTALVRFEWCFLLPYLFMPEQIFEPTRFSEELLGFLTRASGLPMPAGLTARLRSQMGVVVAASRKPAGTAVHAAAQRALGRATTSGQADDTNAAATDEVVSLMPAGTHIANAGMVLLWPFLVRAWEMLGLTLEGRFVDDAAAQRAAWLLQFAVDEQTALPEYQLTLNKLLCGIPLQSPIVPEIDVTEPECALIEQMLTVMISHWTAVGNTSIRGLRETFLQREGYLSHKEDGWHLKVPKKTFDMLVEKLPWSIGTIRLPWMQSILWVEWV